MIISANRSWNMFKSIKIKFIALNDTNRKVFKEKNKIKFELLLFFSKAEKITTAQT